MSQDSQDTRSPDTPEQALPLEGSPPEQLEPASDTEVVEVEFEPATPAATVQVDLAADAVADQLPLAGGPGSQPAPYDPRQAPQWQALIAEFEREIAALGDGPEAARLYYECGRIWEDKLAQPRNAWQCYNKAFALSPTFLPDIRAARRLASQVGNWNVAVQIIDSELAATRSPAQRAHLLHTRGRLLEEKLGRAEDARAAYEAALAENPAHLEVLRQLERMAVAASDWPRVLDLRQRQLAQTDEPQVRVQLLLGLARLQLSHTQDGKAVERTYRQVLELEPQNRIALTALRRLYHASGRWEPLVEVLLHEAALLEEPAAAAERLYRAARLLKEQLGDDERALQCLQQALELVPGDHMVLAEMAQLVEGLMRWQDLVQVLQRQVQVITDRQELVALYFKLGTLLETRLLNEDQAIPCYQRVVELDAHYLPALQALGKLYYRKGLWDHLVRMYEVEVREALDDKQRATRLYKLAEILEERLGHHDQAIQQYEACLEFNAGFLPALQALSRLYTRFSRWDALIQMHERDLANTRDQDQRVFLLDKIGSLWEEKLNNVDKAIETYQRILEINPNHLPAIRSLGKLYARVDRWADIIRVNELEAQLVNDQKQVISLLHRNGEIYEEKLNDKDQAIALYKQVLGLSPAYLPALQSLGRLYFQKGLWADLISMYRQEMEVTQNPSLQATLLYKIGELYEERLAQPDEAMESFREVLRLQPTSFPALKALRRIYRKRQDWESLIDVLEREAGALEDPAQKALSLFQAAEIWEHKHARPERAVDVYQRILQLVPAHGPALQALVRLHTQMRAWRELLAIHERELKEASSTSRQVEVLFRMAELYAAEVNDLVRAAECHERLLALEPGHMPSLEALERIYLQQRNYPALLKVHEAQAERVSDPRFQAALQSRLADIKETRIQPPQNASAHYLKLLRLEPDNQEAARALDILYHRFGTWHGLRLLYERELAQVQTLDEAVDLCLRIADLSESRLNLPAVAIHYLQEALRLEPGNLPAVKALKRLYQSQGDAQATIDMLGREGQLTRDPHQSVSNLLQAGQVYRDQFQAPAKAAECFLQVLERNPREEQAATQAEPLLIALQDWARLAELYRLRLQVTEDTPALQELHMKLGGLFRYQLSRPAEAMPHLREVLRLTPTHLPALLSLAELAQATEGWDEAIVLSSRILELQVEPAVALAAHLRLGIIFQEKRPDLDRAVHHLRQALLRDDANLEALGRLKAIHAARQQWAEVSDVLERTAAADPSRQVNTLLELAQIQEEGLGDPAQAVATFQRVHQLEPTNVEVVQRLGALYTRLERWPELARTLQSFIGLLPPERAAEAIPLHLQLGQLQAERLENQDKAILEYKRVLELSPNDLEAHVALAGLYGRTGLYYANAVEVHRRLLAIVPFRLESLHEMRRIFDEQRAHDKVFCVCAVLHQLRAADSNEEFFYGENTGKVPERTAERLTSEEVERLLVHPDERGLMRSLLQIAGRELSKVYPGDLVGHGVGKADRVRPDDPLRTLANAVLQSQGALEFELYRSTKPIHRVFAENTDPVSLIVGDSLVKHTNVREQRFALARAIRRLLDGSFLASRLGPRELPQLVAALVQPFAPSSALATFPGQLSTELVKRVQKALSRRARKAIEELVASPAAQPLLARRPDYEAYLRGVEHTAARTGLALSGDLPNAVMHLSREFADLQGKRFDTTEEMARAYAPFPVLTELFRFAVSEEYFNLRTRLKLTILS
jgi:tetratricopeptide (TPR) repeat protein